MNRSTPFTKQIAGRRSALVVGLIAVVALVAVVLAVPAAAEWWPRLASRAKPVRPVNHVEYVPTPAADATVSSESTYDAPGYGAPSYDAGPMFAADPTMNAGVATGTPAAPH